MINAIKQFKREHKNAEIRTVSLWEATGHGKNTTYALFNIEYVLEFGGDYYSTQIAVYKNK